MYTNEDSIGDNPWRIAWKTGTQAVRRNRWAALVLWAFGSGIILGYLFVPPVHQALEQVGQLKTRWGWRFSAISTAVFGGALPVFFTWFAQRMESARANRTTNGLSYLCSNVIFWACKGVEIDFFYRFQAAIFGTTSTFETVFFKTAFDQLVYVPTIGLVNVILFYHWRDNGYSGKKFLTTLGANWYRHRVLPVLISNWAIWLPAVVMIYCLPLALQLPVQNLILCFWILILVFFTERASRSAEQVTANG